MNGDDDRVEEQAAEWHVASLRDDMDWDGFARWLQDDPRHGEVYDEIALADGLLDDYRATLRGAVGLQPVERDRPAAEGGRRWPLWLGAGVAASLAAVMVVQHTVPPAPETIESGQVALTVNLGRESTATLAPRSRLTIGGRDGTELALEGGAYFDITHDPSRKLRVTVGNLTVSDVGTRFDVRDAAAHVMIEVGEGEVAVQSAGFAASVQLKAGHRLLYDVAASRAVVSPVESKAVGAWRDGRLSYDSAPLELVAADLGRYAAVRLIVPTALAQRRFSGTLFIGDGDSAIRDLAQLMELELHHDGGAYRLEPAG